MTSPTLRTRVPVSPEAGDLSKPTEIEERVDLYVHRPLAALLVGLLLRTPITPNQVTLISALLGVLAALLLALGAENPWWRALGALALLASVVFDCADGQLARARRVSSTFGAVLDGIADYVVGVTAFVGFVYASVTLSKDPSVWVLGTIAGLSCAVHSALFDSAKLRYTQAAGFLFRDREEDLSRIALERAQARQRGDLKTLLMFWLYDKYTRAQRAALAAPPPTNPTEFRRRYKGQIQLWTYLGIGTHLALLYTGAALSCLWPPALIVCFVIIAGPMNLLLGWLWFQERSRV
jgi:phosphatidylglycerophosphate synthase